MQHAYAYIVEEEILRDAHVLKRSLFYSALR